MTWRNVLGMLVLVALCAAALLWLQKEDATGPAKIDSIVEDFDKRDVTKLTLHGEGIDIVTRRRPDASDAWDVQVGTEWARADAIRIDDVLNALVQSEVIDTFPAAKVTDEQRASYGFDRPPAWFTLHAPGGERTARFGNRTREGSSVYADRGPGTDVVIVSVTPVDEINAALQNGVRDRRISDLRTYDVKQVEVVRDGVTALLAKKDITQVWHLAQPFVGYADRAAFETRVSHLVNEQWSAADDEGARDLPRFGLVKPVATLTLTSKRDEMRVIHLGGEADPEAGTRYAKEEGYGTVFVVSKRFVNAVLADASEVRDRSFARLGLGLTRVTVGLGDVTYVLSKAHTDWEVEAPAREPAEEEIVEDFLEELRQWHVVEFLDGEDPAEYGCLPDGRQIQVTSGDDSLSTYLVGNEAADGNYYAQRKDDGQLVKVLPGPVRRATRGWLQFKRRSGLELVPEDIVFVARDGGLEADDVTDEKWRRDPGAIDKAWKAETGRTGAGLDATAMNLLLSALKSVRPVAWRHWDASRNDEMGFRVDGGAAATAWMEIDFREEAVRLPVYILIGKKLADRDAYYVRVKGEEYVMIVDADTVARLTAPLMKAE